MWHPDHSESDNNDSEQGSWCSSPGGTPLPDRSSPLFARQCAHSPHLSKTFQSYEESHGSLRAVAESGRKWWTHRKVLYHRTVPLNQWDLHCASTLPAAAHTWPCVGRTLLAQLPDALCPLLKPLRRWDWVCALQYSPKLFVWLLLAHRKEAG